MKNIDEYFKFLLKEYSLESLYKKFLLFLYFFAFTRESFFWIIILTQQQKLEDKELMLKIIFLLFSLLIIATIFENIYLRYKVTLKNKLNEVHLKFCFKQINECKLNQVLSSNLVEQFMYIESIKVGLDNIIDEKVSIAFLVVISATVILSARRVNILLVSSLLVFFNGLIFMVQKKNMDVEQSINENNLENINKIRNYFVDSKQRIINDSFNFQYCTDLFQNFFRNNLALVKIENSINTYNSVMVFLITLIIVLLKYKTSSVFDIFVYLLIVYDLDYFVDSLFNLYKLRKGRQKVELHLQKLFENKTREEKIKVENLIIDEIEIITLKNNLPELSLSKNFKLKKGDNILCNGKSGEGKTTFFKFLKNIATPDKLKLLINWKEIKGCKEISDKLFITIQNSKVMYNEKLYDYISNHQSNYNKELIKTLLKVCCIDHIYSGEKDIEIEVEKLSGGEQMRLTLTQTLYNILSRDYEVVLFDEIDVNLDFKTASKILKNLQEMFKNKICMYIIHNEELKDLFEKEITFKNHVLTSNF